MSKKYQFDEEEKQWLTYHTKNSLYILLKKERERTKNLQSQLDQANERLKGAIIPKFKIGQNVWFISDPNIDVYRKVRHIKVEKISISSFFTERGVMYAGGDWAGLSENELFATLKEAQAKLQELRGGE